MTTTARANLGELELPILVFGGPYSNLQATEALLRRARELNIPPARIICTGDVIAYCGDPEATSRVIRESAINVVMGNCEESLATNSIDCGCGFDEEMACAILSNSWYNFAQKNTSQQTREWMQQLPRIINFTIRQRRCSVIHGGLETINQFIFESTDIQVKNEQLEQSGSSIIIGGHCGLPFGQKLAAGTWLNAGVIGLPANDGTADVWYLVIDDSDQGLEATWHRLSYDYQSSNYTMLEHGLTGYADSIISGMWPSMDILPPAEQNRQGQALSPEPLLI